MDAHDDEGESQDIGMLQRRISELEALLSTLPGVASSQKPNNSDFQQILQKNLEQYRAIQNAAFDGICVLNPAGIILEANDAYCHLTGFTRDELLFQHLTITESQDTPEIAQKRIQSTIEVGTACFETKHRKRNGGLLDLEVRTVYTPMAGGQIYCFLRDLTQQKIAAEALRESESKFRSLFSHMSEGMALHELVYDNAGTPIDYILLDFNSAYETITGISRARAIGKRATEVYGTEDSPFLALFSQVALTGRSARVEVDFPPMNKSFMISIFSPRQGRFATVFEDITERLHAQERLRQSEEKLRILFETMAQGVVYQDCNGIITSVNPAAENILGLSRHDMKSINSYDLRWQTIHEDGTPMPGDEHPAIVSLRTGQTAQAVMGVYNAKENRHRWIQVISHPQFKPEETRPWQVFSTFTDITDLKQVQKERDRLFTLSMDMFCIGSLDGHFLQLNPAWTITLGWSIEELKNKEWLDFVHPEDQETTLLAGRQLAEGKPVNQFNNRYRCKDGSYRWLSWNSFPLLDEYKVFAVARDITEHKRTEEALQQRLVALTQPLDESTNIEFQDMFDIEDIQRIQDTFSSATGVASIITRTDGTPITRPSNFCHLCIGLIRATEKGRQNCFYSDAVIGAHNPHGPIVQPCLSGGLWDAGASITVGGRHVANWLIGQVKNDALDEERMLSYARQIGVDEAEFKQALNDVPVMSKEQFQNVANALFLIAKELSLKAYQNLQQARFITERKRAEESLRESEERLRLVMDATSDGVWDWDLKANWAYFSDRYYTMLGYAPFEFTSTYAQYQQLLHPDDRASADAIIHKMLTKEISDFNVEIRLRTKTGEYKWISSRGKIIGFDSAGNPLRIVGTHVDISERKQAELARLDMERHLLHTQKLESLGVLAGGIAHDFNNLLLAVIGNLDMALMDLSPVSSARPSIEQAAFAAQRAVDLTRQLLAYSGKGRFIVKDMNLSELVEENAHMLKAAISKTVTLNLQTEKVLAPIMADAGQIQQIIMNLITNASEAIGDAAGVITLRTGLELCDDTRLRFSRVEEKPAPGTFAYIEVSDSGCGMDEETVHRVFDPFFTTKFAGRGLGMSAVLGIVRGHKGALFLDSQIDQGTTIRVLFPVAAESAQPPPEASSAALPEAPARLSGIVLLVDDEEMVRSLCKRMLERLGMNVILAIDGMHAVEIYRQRAAEIQCVILDLTMPRMDGVTACMELHQINPNVKVLLSSGYSEQEATQRFSGHGLAGFIQKPFRLQSLRVELENILSISKA